MKGYNAIDSLHDFTIIIVWSSEIFDSLLHVNPHKTLENVHTKLAIIKIIVNLELAHSNKKTRQNHEPK